MTFYQEALRYFLRKTFDLREGEIQRAFLMQLNIFLIISTLLIVKSTVQALFVTTYGKESLPLAFVLAAIPAAIVSIVYTRVLSQVAFNKIIIATLASSVGTLTVLGTLLIFNVFTSWAIYVFYIWMTIFALLCTSQFWILANIVFNAREAKRLFGFIGAGAIAGGIFGGYLASALATFMTSESLLFVAAGLLSLCIPITRSIWRQNVKESQGSIQQKKRLGGRDHPIMLILQSRHLTYLAVIIGVSVIVAKLVEYQYTAVAYESYENPEDLTSFFGFWLSTLSIISLLVQLFITHRVVGVFGVGTSLFLLPAGILIGAILLLIFPALWAAVLIRIADGSLKQSINKSATELLALPLPIDIKNRTKSFIDVFIDCFASGIAGLILIFIVSGLDMSTRAICLMIIALIGVWMYFAYLIRREYIKAFKQRMGDGQESSSPVKTTEPTNESVFGGLMRVLESGDEAQIIFVLGKVREIQDKRLFGHIRSLLHHSSPAVRAEALKSLYYYKNDPLIEEVEPMVQDDDENVKIGAFEYLLEHSNEDRYLRMERYLRDEDYRVSGAALVGLAKETRDNAAMKQRFGLEQRLYERLEEIAGEDDPEKFHVMRVDLLKAIGHSGFTKLFFVIESAFHDPDPEVVMAAIAAAGNTLHLSFLPPLLDLLPSDRYFEAAREALLHYGVGIVRPIDALIKQGSLRKEVVRCIPAVLERVDNQAAVDFMLDLLDHEDNNVHLEALRSLNKMKVAFPHLRFQKKAIMNRIMEEVRLYQSTLSVLYAQKKIRTEAMSHRLTPTESAQEAARETLVRLLESRMDGHLERIFRLLGLKYPTEDILPIFEGLQSQRPDLRVNAVEFLENLLDASLKKVLIPVLETALLDGITAETIENLDINIPDEYTCYETLLETKDVKLRMAVLQLLGLTKDPRFVPLVQRYAEPEPGQLKASDKELHNNQ